ncbi:hypothetical protein Tco_0634902 [Tanacetum coccineum]
MIEIQGAFLVKIRDNTFNWTIGENAFEHIDNFLEVVGSLKINRVSQDRFRLSVFSISLAGAASEWFKKDCIGSVTTWENLVEKFVQKFYQLSDDNEEMEADENDDPDNIAEIFKIKGNLFDFDTPLDLEEPWLDNGVPYQLCDHICEPYRFKNRMTKWPTYSLDIDGFCNGGELHGMVWVGCMTYFLDHKWNYGANNTGYTQDNREHEKEHHDPSTCRVRRFEMIEYSFDADDEYVAIKEHEFSEHSETNIDTCQAYQELFRVMDEGWLVKKACDE